VAAVGVSVPAAAADAATGTCRAVDTRSGLVAGPDAGAALTAVLAQASDGATVQVTGRCAVSLDLRRDVRLVGVWTSRTPLTALVGPAGAPTVSVAAGVTASVTRVLVTHGSVGDGSSSPGVVNHGDLTLYATTVAGNAGPAGGILNDGRLALVRSTVTSNAATGDGGGVASSGRLTSAWSTVTGNTSLGDGGGVAVSAGTAVLARTTVTRNTAAWVAGGLLVAEGARVVVEVSVLAANQAGASGPDCAGAPASNGYLVVGDTDGRYCDPSPGVGDLVDSPEGVLEVGFGDLAWNGGPTPTVLPTDGSVLVDLVPVGARGTDGRVLCRAAGLLDQRRVAAPRGAGCDAGAVER
jgi:hypothetical protein